MIDRPLLTIITRHWNTPERAAMLAVNRRSVAEQTCQDFEQILVLDREGRGKRAAAAALNNLAERITGEYVYILDDDDMLIRPRFVEELRQIIEVHAPDVVIARCDHGPLGVKPSDAYWQQPPAVGQIGTPSFVVQRDLYLQFAHSFAEPEQRVGDGLFISRVYDSGVLVYWFNEVVAKTQQIGAQNDTT